MSERGAAALAGHRNGSEQSRKKGEEEHAKRYQALRALDRLSYKKAYYESKLTSFLVYPTLILGWTALALQLLLVGEVEQDFLQALVSLLVLTWVAIRFTRRRKELAEVSDEDPELPGELKDQEAYLAYAEGAYFNREWFGGALLWTNTPRPLSGMPDELYRVKDGRLVIVDTKSEHVEVNAAILQLSIYRIILERGHRQRVADYGYLRHYRKQGGTPFWRKVELLSEEETLSRIDAQAEEGSKEKPPAEQGAMG